MFQRELPKHLWVRHYALISLYWKTYGLNFPNCSTEEDKTDLLQRQQINYIGYKNSNPNSPSKYHHSIIASWARSAFSHLASACNTGVDIRYDPNSCKLNHGVELQPFHQAITLFSAGMPLCITVLVGCWYRQVTRRDLYDSILFELVAYLCLSLWAVGGRILASYRHR